MNRWTQEQRDKAKIQVQGHDGEPIAEVRYYLEAAIELACQRNELLEACKEFVRKCECGEARSTRSYAQMKAAIAKAEVTK